ncbi:MAG: response regulator [Chloroflexota bacterium]
MIRVILVDDHRLLRQGTRALLAEAPDIEIVAETHEGEEALALARRLHPDMVLLDIRLPGLSGIDVARVMRQDLPEIRILILTGYHHEQYVRALFAIGVHGYLLKDASGPELIKAVRNIQGGEQVLSPEIAAQKLQSSVLASTRLTYRELEVLALVSQGQANKQIAQALGVTTRTIETHMSRVMSKLEARSRVEAINAAREQGILPPEEQ